MVKSNSSCWETGVRLGAVSSPKTRRRTSPPAISPRTMPKMPAPTITRRQEHMSGRSSCLHRRDDMGAGIAPPIAICPDYEPARIMYICRRFDQKITESTLLTVIALSAPSNKSFIRRSPQRPRAGPKALFESVLPRSDRRPSSPARSQSIQALDQRINEPAARQVSAVLGN